MVYMDENYELHDDGLRVSGTELPTLTKEQKFWKEIKGTQKILTPEEYKKLYFKIF